MGKGAGKTWKMGTIRKYLVAPPEESVSSGKFGNLCSSIFYLDIVGISSSQTQEKRYVPFAGDREVWLWRTGISEIL